MSYWGWFTGELRLSRQLTQNEVAYLQAFFDTRRMKRDAGTAGRLPDPSREAVGLPIGEEAAYFVGATDHQEKDVSVIDPNVPPLGQPSLWCHLEIADDGRSLFIEETDHLNPEQTAEWIQYVSEHFLNIWDIRLSGRMKWVGQDELDTGVIVVDENSVSAERGILVTDEKGEPRRLRVFLCHASEDKPEVRKLRKKLESLGIEAWLDEENILPGEEWEEAIRFGLRNSDAIMIVLSQKSVKKIGYVQREIRTALNLADERPPGHLYIIPLRLEECALPDTLSKYQMADLFRRGHMKRLEHTLRTIAERLG